MTHNDYYHTAKFNSRVPGSMIDHGIPDPKATDSDASFTPTTSKSFPTTTKSLSTSPSEGPDLFIYIIVAATGIVALLFVVVLLCMILAYCCSMDKKRNHR